MKRYETMAVLLYAAIVLVALVRGFIVMAENRRLREQVAQLQRKPTFTFAEPDIKTASPELARISPARPDGWLPCGFTISFQHAKTPWLRPVEQK